MAKHPCSAMWLPVFLIFAACGEMDPKETPPEEQRRSCPRYEERLPEGCRPVEVSGIRDQEFSFARAGFTLHGTLTLPVTSGEYKPPVFILAHGSGPNDRDETTTGNLGVSYGLEIPTFRLLAERLAHRGAAVYRYDKRSCFRENSDGKCPNSVFDYPGNSSYIMVDDFIEDLRAAVKVMSQLDEVDGRDITVVGHSQGANFVPLVIHEPEVVGGILLAGVSLPVDQVTVEQLRNWADTLEELGATEEQVLKVRQMADRFEDGFEKIRAGTFDEDHLEGAVPEFWKNWMDRTDNLKEEFTAVTKPILVLQGEDDYNVLPSHWERYRSWAEEAEMENATFHLFPNVTHAFVELSDDGRAILDHFSPAAIEAIADWHRAIEP